MCVNVVTKQLKLIIINSSLKNSIKLPPCDVTTTKSELEMSLFSQVSCIACTLCKNRHEPIQLIVVTSDLN